MKISVIIPTYKPEEYLFDCLKSLSKQTFPKSDFEIIIVLNGEIDSFFPYVQSVSNRVLKNNKVKILRTEFGNVSNARNLGLKKSKGEYITFIDDDDYVSDSYLKSLYDLAKLGTVPLAKILVFEDKTNKLIPNYLTKLYNNRKECRNNIINVRSYFSNPVAKLISRKIILNKTFNVNFKNGEDCLFMLEISCNIKSVSFANSSCIYYRRIRKSSAISNVKSKRSRILNNIALIKAYLRVYFHGMFKYNLVLVLTRILAEIRCALYTMLKR